MITIVVGALDIGAVPAVTSVRHNRCRFEGIAHSVLTLSGVWRRPLSAEAMTNPLQNPQGS